MQVIGLAYKTNSGYQVNQPHFSRLFTDLADHLNPGLYGKSETRNKLKGGTIIPGAQMAVSWKTFEGEVHEQNIKTEKLWKNYYKKNPAIVNQ